jgi:integrase
MAALPTGVEIHNGKIRVWFLYRGKRCRETLKGWLVNNANLKKAGNLRAAVTSEIQLGTFDYAIRFPESNSAQVKSAPKQIEVFGDLCVSFLSMKEVEVSSSSFQTLTSIIETLKYIVGTDTELAHIQHSDVMEYRRELLYGTVKNDTSPWLNKTGRAPATVNARISTLCAMLKFAFQSNFISHTPFENVKSLTRTKSPPDPLMKDEYKRLISSLSDFHARIWQFAVFTGLRHGEICALAWEDIDLDAGKLHVRRNLTNKGKFGPPKTAAGVRTITLLTPALAALREQFKLTGAQQVKEITFHHREHGKTEQQELHFVFVPKAQSKSKTGYYSKSSIGYSWRKGLSLAEIRERDPYQSRHTYACWSLSAGANPSFIASQLGHENAKMVYTVYSKWIGEMDGDQAGLLNSKFAGLSL